MRVMWSSGDGDGGGGDSGGMGARMCCVRHPLTSFSIARFDREAWHIICGFQQLREAWHILIAGDRAFPAAARYWPAMPPLEPLAMLTLEAQNRCPLQRLAELGWVGSGSGSAFVAMSDISEALGYARRLRWRSTSRAAATAAALAALTRSGRRGGQPSQSL